MVTKVTKITKVTILQADTNPRNKKLAKSKRNMKFIFSSFPKIKFLKCKFERNSFQIVIKCEKIPVRNFQKISNVNFHYFMSKTKISTVF